jgi:unsaturated chondroitin disaccharide hydrolase
MHRILGILLLSLPVSAQLRTDPARLRTDPALMRTIDTNLQLAYTQYGLLAAHTPDSLLPRSYGNGKWVSARPEWWTSGFVSGTLLRLYSVCHDTALLREALHELRLLAPEQYDKGTHDLGFLMYDSYGVALHVLGDTSYARILLNSAHSLSTRFNPKVGCIKSWDHGSWKYPVIIDNMMNLELLFWATAYSGDSSFYHIAVTHANTTLRNHFRPDYSSYHVVDYDTATGAVLSRKTAQGYADSSAWARGQAWGLYGYTMAYRYTKDRRYLEQAEHIAHFLLTHLPPDGVPYWDFDHPRIPDTYRDASAGAVIASALIELSGYVPRGQPYVDEAAKILRTLSSPAFRAGAGENGGYLLEHSVGNIPAHSEVDVALTYADYYFVEAMLRYRALTTPGPHPQ